MARLSTLLAGLTACTLLAGCLDIPDYRGSAAFRPGTGTATPSAPLGAPLGTAAPSAGTAESACTAAGREAGFDVQGVTGTREVTAADGLAQSRDVMLRVQRGGQSFDVRCSYSYAANSARIMTL